MCKTLYLSGIQFTNLHEMLKCLQKNNSPPTAICLLKMMMKTGILIVFAPEQYICR